LTNVRIARGFFYEQERMSIGSKGLAGTSHIAEQTSSIPSVLHRESYSIVIDRQSYSTRDRKTTYIYFMPDKGVVSHHYKR
jgi:hypothetical protein